MCYFLEVILKDYTFWILHYTILDFSSVIFDLQTFRHHGKMRAMKDAISTFFCKQQVEQQIVPDKCNSLFSGIINDHNTP